MSIACPLILRMLDIMVRKDYIGAITNTDTRRKRPHTQCIELFYVREYIFRVYEYLASDDIRNRGVNPPLSNGLLFESIHNKIHHAANDILMSGN